MSAAIGLSYGVEWAGFNLKSMFRERTGGRKPVSHDKKWDLNHDYFTPVLASADVTAHTVALSGSMVLGYFAS